MTMSKQGYFLHRWPKRDDDSRTPVTILKLFCISETYNHLEGNQEKLKILSAAIAPENLN